MKKCVIIFKKCVQFKLVSDYIKKQLVMKDNRIIF